MNFLVLEEVDSTNSYVSLHANELEDMTMIIANSQTAGRGQRGNSWESAPGRNLTFTLLHRSSGVAPSQQFSLSEAVALAIRDFLREAGIEARIKWPNDIYVGDRKISGILIEHAILGTRIEHSRIGVGLNVNQLKFESDAPNPVSMIEYLGAETDISHAAAKVGCHLERRLQSAGTPEGRHELHEEFRSALWRGKGIHPFRERESGKRFRGKIEDVAKTGPIKIKDMGTGETKEYAFKEVEFLLT